MSAQTAVKKALKKEEKKQQKEISPLKKIMDDYKTERKADWKSFKSKMNTAIEKMEKQKKN